MRTPNLEAMIEEVYEELAAKEDIEEFAHAVATDKLNVANNIFNAGKSMKLLQQTRAKGGLVEWALVDKTNHPVEGGSITNASNTNLRITNGNSNVPPRLTAPLIPSTLGNKSSFKPGRHKRHAKS